MADNKDKERSPLWGTAAWTSIAGGTGYGLYKSTSELKDFYSKIVSPDIISNAVSELKTLGRFQTTGRVVNPFNPTSEFFMKKASEKVGEVRIIRDIASISYRSILAGGGANAIDAAHIYNAVASMKSIDEALEYSRKRVAQHGGDMSIYNNAFSSFNSYSDKRMEAMKNTIRSSGHGVRLEPGESAKGKIESIRGKVSMADIYSVDQEAYERGLEIQKKLAMATNDEIKWNQFYLMEDTLDGKKVTTPMMRGFIGSQSIEVPLRDTGLTYGGQNMTARYITRGAYDREKDSLDFVTRYVNEVEKNLLGKKNRTEMKKAILEANLNVIESSMDDGAKARSQAVWMLPEEVATSGDLAKARITRLQSVYAGEGRFTESLRNQIIDETLDPDTKRSLYPFGSPQTVAKGTMMRKDIAQEIYGPMGRLMSVEQRPTQFIRGWGVTEDSLNAATEFRGSFGKHYDRLERKIQGSGYREILYGDKQFHARSAKAFSSPQLTTFYSKGTKELADIMSPEEMLISKDVTNMMEYERVVQKKINIDAGLEVNKRIEEAAKGLKTGEVKMFDSPITNGEFLGIERTGQSELFAKTAGGKAEVIGMQVTGGPNVTLFQKEKYKLAGNEWWKFFSEDVKFMGHSANEVEMHNALVAAGAPIERAYGERNFIAGQQVEAISDAKLLRKNRMAQMTQQIEALSMIASDKADQGMFSGKLGRVRRTEEMRLLKKLMSDPEKTLGVHRLTNMDDIAKAELEIQQDMVSMARKFKFNETEMGLTFGMMDETRADQLGIGKAVRESTGVVGLSKMKLGDLATEGGAGGRASFEATGFRMLSMKGQEGERFAAELVTRMQGKGGLAEMDLMEASVLNATSTSDKVKAFMGKIPTEEQILGSINEGDLIKDTGRYVNLGRKVEAFGGADKIYIPGKKEAGNLLSPMVADSGNLMDSPLARDIKRLNRVMGKENVSAEEIEAAASGLKSTVVQETAAQTSGKGKIIGSKMLTGIRQTAKQSADDVFGVSRASGESIFDDLLERATSEEQKVFLSNQKNKFLSGETLSGGLWRHPTYSPESFQFMKYRLDENLADKMISVPKKEALLDIGGKQRMVDTSAMVGMKGDFDRDFFNLAAISDEQTAARVGTAISSKQSADYTKYLFNHYAMKDLMEETQQKRTPNVLLDYRSALKQGAKDLTTAPIATPQVNIALQKLKLGLQHSSPKEYRPLADLFYHLEEAAIGGKHGSLQSEIYQDIAHAVEKKDVGVMQNVIESVMGKDKRVIRGSLGGAAQETVYDPAKFAKVAIDSASAAGNDVDMAYNAVRAAKGNLSDRTELNDLIAMHYRRKQGSIDVLPSLMQAKEYGGEGIETNINRLLRKGESKASMFGKAVSKAKGPALIGAALAAGVMMASPSLSGSVQGYREGSNGGRNIQPDALGPPQGVSMSAPSSRIMSAPKAYDMSGIKSSTHANIRMSMSDSDASRGSIMDEARKLSMTGNTRIRTRDDRTLLDPQRLANKIHERL